MTRTISSTVSLHDRERQLADFAHRDAVGEDADVIERDARARRRATGTSRRPRTARRR